MPTLFGGTSAAAIALVVWAAAVAGSVLTSGDTTRRAEAAAAVPADAALQFPGVDGATQSGPVHNFYFSRGAYSGRGRSWSTDAPAADRWIANVIRRLTLLDVSPSENFIALDDPDLARYPFIYILEVGGMVLRESEVEGLRNYLLKGGFVMVDDFWGSYEWANWEREIRRVLPEYEIVEVPLTHDIFSSMYGIDEIIQVPGVNGIRRGVSSQDDGYVPYVRGIFDEKGRLMMVINWNTDLGDAWEWAEASYYPLEYSTYAYQVAANTLIYALTH